jgi:hypothetical protein
VLKKLLSFRLLRICIIFLLESLLLSPVDFQNQKQINGRKQKYFQINCSFEFFSTALASVRPPAASCMPSGQIFSRLTLRSLFSFRVLFCGNVDFSAVFTVTARADRNTMY